MGWVVNATPQLPYPWERPGTHCIGGWVGPRAGLDRCGESCPPDFPALSYTSYAMAAPHIIF